ncbi:MAG TPA: phospholipase D-like domain-containing protein [Candidatus Eisenbacteria bacterium]|nr:phospholipase D-like domain-containing protein [Candidatus Eisenbacteria bacterium]
MPKPTKSNPYRALSRALESIAILLCLQMAACGLNPFMSWETTLSGRLSDDSIRRHASSRMLPFTEARVILGNDAAFRSKLEMIEQAKTSIDAMYYIYSDDYSSSVLSEALIAAARRGVRVRLLLDYHSHYKDLDLFTMMERRGSSGSGSLQVRFYNRPTRNMVMDAVYLTMGCGRAGEARKSRDCSAEKFAEIERLFATERIDGVPASELGISNLSAGNSGLFLSGLYSKKPEIMAFAVLRGQDVDLAKLNAAGGKTTAEDKENLKRVARIYWNSRVGSPFRRLTAKLQLAVIFHLYGEALNPIYDTLAEHFPLERPEAAAAALDWEYMTDFLHHKLLLVDQRVVQLGGRNIEDSYHMRPNEMVEKYIFLDTDMRIRLAGGGEDIGRAFDDLWNFRRMVASTAEVRQHAPNEFSANFDAYEEAEKACGSKGPKETQEACIAREFEKRSLGRFEREERRYRTMRTNAERYWREYRYAKAPDPSPDFTVDRDALLAYVENLPFLGGPNDPKTTRAYGAVNGEEAKHGKRIHALWMAGLEQACRTASAEQPRRVILHQAYFFPPSNLIKQFSRMINGELDCRHVTVTILTNSIATTDLNLVNLLARHAAKAFADFYQSSRDPQRGARFEYYEYRKFDEKARMSLHTKVTVLGDDVMIGSANADVRSYMMDSNNGMLIRRAPKFLEQYVGHLQAFTKDPSKTQNMTVYFATVSREQMIAEDRETFRSLLKKYRVERWMDAEEQGRAEALYVQKLNEVYFLTRMIVSNGPGAREAEKRFNRIYKPI